MTAVETGNRPKLFHCIDLLRLMGRRQLVSYIIIRSSHNIKQRQRIANKTIQVKSLERYSFR